MINFLRRFRRAWNIARGSGNKLRCSDCGCQIHRYERYTIIEARHRNCRDPKQVGQQIMPGREGM